MSRKTKNILSIIINAFIIISTFVIVSLGVSAGAGEGQVGEGMYGLGYYKAFTMDSNILSAVTSFIILIFNINSLVEKKETMPAWAVKAQLIGAGSVALTFLTVIFFLCPLRVAGGKDPWVMFTGDMFFFHLLNPVLAFISYSFLSAGHKCSRLDNIISIAPTVLYSLVYMPCVLTGIWSDFYGFTFGGKVWAVPISLICMYAATYFINFGIIRLHNKFAK